MSKRTIHCFPDSEALAGAVCEALVALVKAKISSEGVFRIALSGGSTPRRLYQLLAERSLPWDKIHWFWGDERNVPADHADSNYRMVREALLNHIPDHAETVFPIPVQPDQPTLSAQRYEDQLRQEFPDRDFPNWDLALLGLGDDAHTASLFPRTQALAEQRRWCVANEVPQLQTLRYTLTAPAINAAQNIWFLVAGGGKRPALTQVWSDTLDPYQYPAQLIPLAHPGSVWWVTNDALPEAH